MGAEPALKMPGNRQVRAEVDRRARVRPAVSLDVSRLVNELLAGSDLLGFDQTVIRKTDPLVAHGPHPSRFQGGDPGEP